MLYKIVPFLIWFHRFSTLVGKVKVTLVKDVLPEKLTKSQLQPTGLALLILLPGAPAANRFTGPNSRNLLDGSLPGSWILLFCMPFGKNQYPMISEYFLVFTCS